MHSAYERRVRRLRERVLRGRRKTPGSMTVKELRKVAAKKGVEGYNFMRKEELLEALKE